jgi:hypothetical protein
MFSPLALGVSVWFWSTGLGLGLGVSGLGIRSGWRWGWVGGWGLGLLGLVGRRRADLTYRVRVSATARLSIAVLAYRGSLIVFAQSKSMSSHSQTCLHYVVMLLDYLD